MNGVTITDVASDAGVSIRTVSRVLNRSSLVNRETRERVEGAIARLGFRPSSRARGLATGRSYLLGLVHNDRNALVLDEMQRGIVSVAAARGYELVVHPTPDDADRLVDDVIGFVHRSRVDGVIVLPPVSGAPGVADALRAAGVRAAAMSAVPIAGYASLIVSQEREAAADVARYLLDRGHRRIGLINGPLHVYSASERRAGFVAALSDAGLALVAESEGAYDFESGYEAAVRLIGLADRPTAVFAANDFMAAALLKAATAAGIHVPDDLSVVGFDGSLIARMLTPALTTVARPLEHMARIAAERLLDQIEGGVSGGEYRVSLTLTEGGSVAPPRD